MFLGGTFGWQSGDLYDNAIIMDNLTIYSSSKNQAQNCLRFNFGNNILVVGDELVPHRVPGYFNEIVLHKTEQMSLGKPHSNCDDSKTLENPLYAYRQVNIK